MKIKRAQDGTLSQITELKNAMEHADVVIIGAGAGLSTSAGFTYSGERFKEHFSDFEEKYGFHDMYSGGFYPFETPEEKWAYWSRNIYYNRYVSAPKPVYNELYRLVEEKDYFVITTNVDHCFQKAGFDKKRLFYTQGDYGLFQCSVPCRMETFDNEEAVTAMLHQQKDMCIPSSLLPTCPYCKSPMTTNLRADDRFVEDEGWHRAAERYESFLREKHGRKILFLELGVGYNTPGIIKYPFWQMTAQSKDAVYACVNMTQAACPVEIEKQSILIEEDIGTVIHSLLEMSAK